MGQAPQKYNKNRSKAQYVDVWNGSDPVEIQQKYV